ncbi:MAG: hypothetical protein PVF58_10870 [Candidatus Methanofastidiosia archaeon]|jgi:hypothetical protein
MKPTALIISIGILLIAGCEHNIDPEETPLCQRHPEVYTAMEEYPWVKWATRRGTMPEVQYIEDICILADIDPVIAYRIMYAQWITDYVSDKEAQYLKTVVKLARSDPEIAKIIVNCWWLSDTLQDKEIDAVSYIYSIFTKDKKLAETLVTTQWFQSYITIRELRALEIIYEAPPPLALVIVNKNWFKDYLSYEEVEVTKELIKFHTMYPEKVFKLVNLSSFSEIDQKNMHQLRIINSLIQKNPLLFENLKVDPLTADTWSIWSSLSSIALKDEVFAVTIHDRLVNQSNPDSYAVENLAGLFNVHTEFAYYLDEIKYIDQLSTQNSKALRFLYIFSEFQPVKIEQYDSVISAAEIASTQFVYEDRFEQYRYHLLWHTLQVIDPDQITQYHTMVRVSLEIYGERFYKWKVYEQEYKALSNDESLNNTEFFSYIHLLKHFMEGDLVTDIDSMSEDHLYYLLYIPYEYQVNADGSITSIEELSSPLTRGSAAVLVTCHNILGLDQRNKILYTEWEDHELHKKYVRTQTPLTEKIIQEGDIKDKLFIFISEKHWESPTEEACICHTYQSIMDLTSVGIPSTWMYWYSGESAHMFPAYVPSDTILDEIEKNPAKYDNPFMYNGFISPWDKAGYKNLKSKDILVIQAYNVHSENLESVWGKPEGFLKTWVDVVLLLLMIGVVVFVVAKVIHSFFSMKLE